MKAQLSISELSGISWDVALEGVHLVESGAILLSTSSDRFTGSFAIPFLARSEAQFDAVRQHLTATTEDRVDQNGYNSSPQLEQDTFIEDIFPLPQCEYVVYLQQHFVWPFDPRLTDLMPSRLLTELLEEPFLSILERELRFPSGLILDFIPDLRFSATIFSPDCGFVLESEGFPEKAYSQPGRHLKGQLLEVSLSKIKQHAFLLAVVIFIQLILLVRQAKDASTPSTRSRISYYTIGIMIMADIIAMASSLFLGSLITETYLPITSLSFSLFLSAPLLGMKFFMDIWSVQAPEREERERQRRAAQQDRASTAAENVLQGSATQNSAIISAAGADVLPLPVTARRVVDTGVIPIIIPSDQDVDATILENELQTAQNVDNGNASHHRFSLAMKFIALSFSLTIVSWFASSWPPSMRLAYTNLLICGYLSFWIPQIGRNILRNCRKALRWEFLIGQALLRLVPIGYCYLYESNVLGIKTAPYTFAFFGAWQWAQILILASQSILGPRFFIPAGMLPPAYDYHQILHEGDEETGGFMPAGSVSGLADAAGESKEKGKWTSDCIICMHTLEALYVPQDSNLNQGPQSATAISNIFARRDYMITPCRHIFHTQCLEGWMKYKLQCPICRESLPPV